MQACFSAKSKEYFNETLMRELNPPPPPFTRLAKSLPAPSSRPSSSQAPAVCPLSTYI